MSRKKQNFIPSTYYHLSNIGNSGEEIFIDKNQIDFFILRFNQHTQRVFTIISWCILQNQFHFVVKIRSRKKILKTFSEYKRLSERLLPMNRKEISLFLSQVVADFCNSYAKAYNKNVGRKGSLFRENFRKRILINHDEMVRTVRAMERLPYIDQTSGFSNFWVDDKLEKSEGVHIQLGPPVVVGIDAGMRTNLLDSDDSAEVQIIEYAKELLLE